MMRAYYNEIDPKAAAWLRELIAAGLIAPGDVDERSIEDVTAHDLRGYRQCHFFAGIGGWSYALRLAGWPDDREVWTGSCPCQPFSAAGKSDGFADERHLWPAFHWLIAQCRPSVVFGEQVASPAGRGWLDLVATDCEAAGYAFGAVNLPAASVQAPHLRERLWWVACAIGAGLEGFAGHGDDAAGWSEPDRPTTETGATGDLADNTDERRIARRSSKASDGRDAVQIEPERLCHAGFWSACDWIPCRDDKWRPVEPGSFPLAHGVSARVGRLRGYGNAIVPQVAAEVIAAYMAGAE